MRAWKVILSRILNSRIRLRFVWAMSGPRSPGTFVGNWRAWNARLSGLPMYGRGKTWRHWGIRQPAAQAQAAACAGPAKHGPDLDYARTHLVPGSFRS